MIPELFQILDVAVADLTDDKVAFALTGARLPRLHGRAAAGGATAPLP